MASLRQQQNKPDEVIQYLEPALAFYQQGGYRSATSSCLALLARADLQKGDYAAAEKAHEQLLKLGQESNDQSLIAQAHAERGSALAREEKFTEALDQLTQAYVIYNSLGIQRSVGYNLVERAYVLGRMGRYSEAQPLLDQAAAIADKPGGEIKRLSLEVKLVAVEIDLSQERFPDAKDKAEKLLAIAGTQFPAISANGSRVLGMAQAYGGAAAAGKAKCAEAVELAKQLNDPWQLAKAQLALAETMLLSGDSQGASKQLPCRRRKSLRGLASKHPNGGHWWLQPWPAESQATKTKHKSMLCGPTIRYPNLSSAGVRKTMVLSSVVRMFSDCESNSRNLKVRVRKTSVALIIPFFGEAKASLTHKRPMAGGVRSLFIHRRFDKIQERGHSGAFFSFLFMYLFLLERAHEPFGLGVVVGRGRCGSWRFDLVCFQGGG